MIAIPGFRAAAQSRKESVSLELVKRVRYQLENIGEPLKRYIKVERPHPTNGVRVISAFGEPVESYFVALGEGEEQWRFEQLTLGILDEAAYNRYAAGCYSSALACVEGGGKLIVISTGKFATWYNKQMLEMLSRAKEVSRWQSPPSTGGSNVACGSDEKRAAPP
jgi:hypothetical protein